MKFERIDVSGGNPLPDQLKQNFTDYPLLVSGLWPGDQLKFKLHWNTRNLDHLPEGVRTAIKRTYRENWHRAEARKTEQLEALRERQRSGEITMEERRQARKRIMPFPGVTMTFRGFEQTGRGLSILTQVGSYPQVHPEFGISSPKFLNDLQKTYPEVDQEDLWKIARGMGVQVIPETSDGYIIFGQRSTNVMGAGFVGNLGITPNISDEDMSKFISQSAGRNGVDVPASWLFDSIRKDIAEHDELNLESEGLEEAAYESIDFIGAIESPKDGWLNLVNICKLTIPTTEVERLWSNAPDHEYESFFFVKSNPESLSEVLTKRNVYPSLFGGYHAYYKTFYPELL